MYDGSPEPSCRVWRPALTDMLFPVARFILHAWEFDTFFGVAGLRYSESPGPRSPGLSEYLSPGHPFVPFLPAFGYSISGTASVPWRSAPGASQI